MSITLTQIIFGEEIRDIKIKLMHKAVIGSSNSADYILRYPKISPEHCELRVYRERRRGKVLNEIYYLTDLNSSSGTYVSNVRLEPNVAKRLLLGDEISFSGDINFKVKKMGLEEYKDYGENKNK